MQQPPANRSEARLAGRSETHLAARHEARPEAPAAASGIVDPLPQSHASLRCTFCASRALRQSRMRRHDLPLLLMLLKPVRCLQCGRRQRAWLWRANRALPASTPHLKTEGSTGRMSDSSVIAPERLAPRSYRPEEQDASGPGDGRR